MWREINWERGVRSGTGTHVYSSGSEYEGEFFADKKEGFGNMKFANGNFYEGDFSNDLMNGQGFMLYKNGDEYLGEFLNDKRHGKGVMKKKYSGDNAAVIEEGLFQNDEYVGP